MYKAERHLTSPARLGRPLTEEATELTELMEELLGLWASDDTPIAIRLLFLALAGLVEGKPMRITLWMGANRPNLGRHWKYLQTAEGDKDAESAMENCNVLVPTDKKIGKRDFLRRPPCRYYVINGFDA